MSFPREKALELIDRAAANRRLAHAYLVTGPSGSGKEAVAVHLIGMTQAQPPPPGATLESLRGPTTVVLGPESKSRRITVESIREAEHVLHMRAPAGVTKFAVIQDADCLTVPAENAFLKTLEEPPPQSRLILVTAKPELLLETILSRCIRIDLMGTPGAASVPEGVRPFLRALESHSCSGIRGVSGALGLMAAFSALLKEERAEVARANDAAFKEECTRYQKTTEGRYLKQREEYYRALTESHYLLRRNRLLEFLLMWFADALREQNGVTHRDLPDFARGTEALARQVSTDELSRKVEAVDELRGHLNTNAQEALALEVGFIRAFG